MPAIARFLYGITLLFFNVDGKVKEQMLKDLEVRRRERLENLNLNEEDKKVVEMNINTHMGTKFPQEKSDE